MQELFESIRLLHVSGVGNSNKEKFAIKNLVSVKVNWEELVDQALELKKKNPLTAISE